MPSSPAVRISPGRISPGRELKAVNHKRGRSLESGILFQEKDDDLALFNEVQNVERENFLLQSNDDFDDMFSTKPRHLSEYKLGISIPARGESRDLLIAEGDKNDYDWLITPPDTPLFPSLDDETTRVSLAPRGRPRSQPITISRSSTMEKGYKSGRGSPSPRRLSPSPRSSTRTLQSKSRPFSATHSSPPPSSRHSSPSRKLSPPPSKPTPAPRNRTPTPRRMSTGSASVTPSRVRGASPVKTSRGNSASPKIKAWQSNIPGFSLEAPPNLRTSLADRPASYVRGSSPASRNGSRSGRQSMSPTASRSVSSSHSHERDQYSSYSRGSVASSGDDDADSLQSVPISNSERSVPRSIVASPNNKAMGFAKKPTKSLSNSAPKRTFDLALRQMERKGPPQNMFRPLLSSVPSSTFHAGKASTHHRTLTSRNSSITTSSNASSDQGNSGALEENEQNQDDATSDFVKGQYQTMPDEVFVMDHSEAFNEAIEDGIIVEVPAYQDEEIDNPSRVISGLDAPESSRQLEATPSMASADAVFDGIYDYSDADVAMEVCSGCSDRFPSSELLWEGDLRVCLGCSSLKTNSVATLPVENVEKDKEIAEDFALDEDCGWLEVVDQSVSIPESIPVTGAGEITIDHLESTVNDDHHSDIEPRKDREALLPEKSELKVADLQEIVRSVGDCSTSEADVSEGTGISLLLKRSSCSKGHLVQSRSFTASNICYDDFSYLRDSMNSMRSSGGYSNASLSSSTDLGSSRQMESRTHRQSSGRRSDTENYRYEIPSKHKRSISSVSGASILGSQVQSTTPSCLEECFELVSSNKDREDSEVTYANPLEQTLASVKEAEIECKDLERNLTFKAAMELSSDLVSVHSGSSQIESILASEEPVPDENGENLTNKSGNSINEETATKQLQTSTQVEDTVQSSCDVTKSHLSSLSEMSDIEIQNADIVSCDPQSDDDSTNSKTCTNELLEPSVSGEQNGIMTTEEFGRSGPVHCVLEESTVVVEDVGGTKTRSLTLEEATDTILFCSSIVHNLAYEAANIALEKEDTSMEVLRPTVTLVGKSNSDRREIRSRPLGKRSSKSQKSRQRRLEPDSKARPITPETEEKSSPRIVRSPGKGETMHPPKLESKCNCTIM